MPQDILGSAWHVAAGRFQVFDDGTIYIDGAPVLGGISSGGRLIYVNPNTGDDSNDGLSAAKAIKTLVQAQVLATANQNDIVVLLATTDAATPGTYRVPAGGLNWAKDGVHLIGQSGGGTQQRARISNATTDVATNTVFNNTGKNCLFANFSVFHGVASWTGTGGGVPTAFKHAGQHCSFKGVTISGMGDGSASNSMDQNLGSSLWLAGSENKFEDCYIGLDTVYLGNKTSSCMTMSGAVSRNRFNNCKFASRGNHANHAAIQVQTSGMQDMAAEFDKCLFTNSGIFAGGLAGDGVFKVAATQNGGILVNGSSCGAVGYSFWEKATVSGYVYVSNPAVGAGKAGLGTVAVGS
jgi:hypothetical protein